ncbi:hypothetical protein AGABI2DRAFT_176336, partial [Agaricus bisporus var. bisporus H97]|uniref:hypothetical protein n=1 Tax=Agaricus bisporus var. bisporus (strain H97 / ATCC MYA-4626 / FGSC 10389) TaxID=936046 RepID=UPI00029F6A2B
MADGSEEAYHSTGHGLNNQRQVLPQDKYALSEISIRYPRKIPFEDPIVLGYVRIAYITAQVVILATYYYVSLAVYLSSKHVSLIRSQIKRKNDQTVLKYIEAAAPMVCNQHVDHACLHRPTYLRNMFSSSTILLGPQ